MHSSVEVGQVNGEERRSGHAEDHAPRKCGEFGKIGNNVVSDCKATGKRVGEGQLESRKACKYDATASSVCGRDSQSG